MGAARARSSQAAYHPLNTVFSRELNTSFTKNSSDPSSTSTARAARTRANSMAGSPAWRLLPGATLLQIARSSSVSVAASQARVSQPPAPDVLAGPLVIEGLSTAQLTMAARAGAAAKASCLGVNRHPGGFLLTA